MFNNRQERYTFISIVLGAIPSASVGAFLFFIYENIWFLCFDDYPPHDIESGLSSMMIVISSFLFFMLFSVEIMHRISNFILNRSELYTDKIEKDYQDDFGKKEHQKERKRIIINIIKSLVIMILSVFVTMAFYGFGVSFRVAEGIAFFTVIIPSFLWAMIAYTKSNKG